jgi:hypothetical protein
MTDSVHSARSAIVRLLRGEAPNGIAPHDCGPWASVVHALAEAYAAGGTPAVRGTFSALARAHQDLAALIASDAPAFPPASRALFPALPAAATAIYSHAAPCAQWLDDYIAFATQAAPMTPRSFHEAAGLIAVSVAVARRLVVHMSMFSFYPNLFILWIGAPGTYHKSTGFAVLQELTKAAGLRKHLLPKRITPEALLHEMSAYLPDDFDTRTPAARETFLGSRAVAAQRAWLIDEASFLFSSMKRDYNAPLGDLLLEMWDCPDELGDQTISRGAQAVRGIYLTLFGATTPKNMEAHLQNPAFWLGGLWSRFALIVAEERSPWAFFPAPLSLPAPLVEGLRQMATLFPESAAEVVEHNSGAKTWNELFVAPATPLSAELAPGVVGAWEAYAKATSYDLHAAALMSEEELQGSYTRFAGQVLRVAMLLATMDAVRPPICIELRHWARAQTIVEGWRASLHQLRYQGITTDEEHLAQKILARLSAVHPAGKTARELSQELHRASDTIVQVLQLLLDAGQVAKTHTGRKTLWYRPDEV